MLNESLLKEVKKAACSCDMAMGWTCVFCEKTLPKLRKALQIRYRKHRSPYEPRKLPKQRWIYD